MFGIQKQVSGENEEFPHEHCVREELLAKKRYRDDDVSEEDLVGREVLNEKRERNESAHESAVKITHEWCDYRAIREHLDFNGLLKPEVARVESEYRLQEMLFLGERDREIFTILDLYDSATARHCYETYRIAKGKMEKEILPGISFESILRDDERVSLEQFYRACLLHDIGKINVPSVVINAVCSDTHKMANEVLSAEDIAEIKKYGFTGEETLFEIIKVHEMKSGEILKSLGLEVESILASHHHNYGNEELKYPIAIGALHISVDLVDILHLADVEQALSVKRSYHNASSIPRIMKILVDETNAGKIAPLATLLWLCDDLDNYDSRKNGEESEEDAKNMSVVRDFIDEKKREFNFE